MKTKSGGSVGIDNQNAANGGSGVAGPPAISTSNIIDRSTTGAASGGFGNDNQTLTSSDRAPKGQGPTGLLAVEQAYAKPTDASTPAALVGSLPR